MPPKKKGNRNVINHEDKKRDLILKEDLEEYARVEKILGDGRFSVILCTGESVISIIAKRFRRKNKKGGKGSEKVFIGSGDIVLVAFRSFENKCDIIFKYEKNEISRLIDLFEIPSNFITGSSDTTKKIDGFEIVENDEQVPEIEIAVAEQNRKFEIDSSESELDFDNL